MKLIYLAHPYGGQERNYAKAKIMGSRLERANPGVHIFNAVPYFRYFTDYLEESEIMKMCLDMVARCDELWAAPGWENSPGCRAEIQEATRLGIRVRYLAEGTE